jgi:hypothetical protein
LRETEAGSRTGSSGFSAQTSRDPVTLSYGRQREPLLARATRAILADVIRSDVIVSPWYNDALLMRSAAIATWSAFVLVCLTGGAAEAQIDPSIGPFVVDVRGTFPGFPTDLELAESRGLDVSELPGRGLGVDVGGHVYLFTWKVVTFGLGAQFSRARSGSTPPADSDFRAVTEEFTSFAPQLSFNFGTGDGWSYISGGIGSSTWSVVPDDQEPGPADEERLFTINYGGGARWFAKPHLAFTVDVRFYAIDAGTPQADLPGSPRTTLLIIGAGISIK